MSVGWQRFRRPLLERLALAELAEKCGQNEENRPEESGFIRLTDRLARTMRGHGSALDIAVPIGDTEARNLNVGRSVIAPTDVRF